MRDTIDMAREAGLLTWLKPPKDVIERFNAFEALVRADERAQALAAQPAPVQEPVAWKTDDVELYVREDKFGFYNIPLYTHPAQPAVHEPVSGVVLRDGYPTLIQDKHIKETDQRLCILPTTPPAAPVPLTDEDVAIMEAVRREMEDKVYSKNAPGHAHHTPGIWDEDNGDLAGKPCAWCLTWKKFTGLIEREADHGITKGQP